MQVLREELEVCDREKVDFVRGELRGVRYVLNEAQSYLTK